MALQHGELIEWNDARGFGFIRPDGGGAPIFVHISQIGRIAARPRTGDRVGFASGTGRDGRPAAVNVKIAGANPFQARPLARGAPPAPVRTTHRSRLYAAFVLLALLLVGLALGTVPLWLGAVYGGLGVISALLYYRDKTSAEAGGWRTPEVTLHSIDLACGIIGGLLAQDIFHHKTAKQPFVAMTWLIAAVHGLWLAGLATGRISLVDLASLIPG